MLQSPETLLTIAHSFNLTSPAPPLPERILSIWEITRSVLPMAPEHFRRVLAAHPDLPQGVAEIEGGTRWFSLQDVALLRGHFAALSRRHRPQRPEGSLAPLVALTGPLGGSGRSTALVHLAIAASLAGWRVLAIDGDPGGRLAQRLGAQPAGNGGVLAFLAQAVGQRLRRLNESRIDRGEAPQPLDDTVAAALTSDPVAGITPTRWPGLDLLPATSGLLEADRQLAVWQSGLRGWQTWDAAREAVAAAGLRQRYDLILCDTGRGLGPLALSLLGSADLLLAPLPPGLEAEARLGQGLVALGGVAAGITSEERATALALGRDAPQRPWRQLWVLPTRAIAGSPGFRPEIGLSVLPAALPELPFMEQDHGSFYDLDYRDMGRLAYTPLRDACGAAFKGFADVIDSFWQVTADRS